MGSTASGCRLSRRLHITDSDFGLLQAFYSFPNIILMLFSGHLIGCIGARRSVFLFGFTTFAGLVVTALTPRPGFA